jgi:deoxyribodipyrimidine photo-lyase
MSTLVWFRRDLRLADNPALEAAAATGEPVIPVYIFAPGEESPWAPGGASRWWLHGSLSQLCSSLHAIGSSLCIRQSENSLATLEELARECGARRILWNRCYEPAAIERDQKIKSALRDAGLETESYNGTLLHEPWTIRTQGGGPFQVFSAFWRSCKSLDDPPEPKPAPEALRAPASWPGTHTLESLGLLPTLDWPGGLKAAWTPGSDAAHSHLERFLAESFDDYGNQRDRPAVRGTSRLSPHLHFGEIGPREIWHATRRHALAGHRHSSWRDSQFLAEIGWREFAYHLLFHFPRTPEQPLKENYARFPWKSDPASLRAWQRGATGYPIVDAGMRELWHTGWMHNRVRMIAASFLVKDLLLPWTEGARWFWDTLVDADLASNTLGWQWVAGCGADAAPFFRIFNPTTQGIKFDGAGDYVRRWVPEIAALPDEWLHRPWEAPSHVLEASGVTLGRTYPHPLVDHTAARNAALAALATVKPGAAGSESRPQSRDSRR